MGLRGLELYFWGLSCSRWSLFERRNLVRFSIIKRKFMAFRLNHIQKDAKYRGLAAYGLS